MCPRSTETLMMTKKKSQTSCFSDPPFHISNVMILILPGALSSHPGQGDPSLLLCAHYHMLPRPLP